MDIVINNAGIVRDAPFEDMTPDRLEPLLDVHLRGAFYVTRPAWKVMREQRYGRIVNTCSAAGILGAERMSNYGVGQDGPDRLHPGLGRRRSRPQHQGQRHRPDCLHPDVGALDRRRRPARTTPRLKRYWMTLSANIFRSSTQRWWLPWWRF